LLFQQTKKKVTVSILKKKKKKKKSFEKKMMSMLCRRQQQCAASSWNRGESFVELIALNNLRDNAGARKKARRVGRGEGSSKGKTCGRGHKGQGQHAKKPRPGFEGGQTPLYRRVKKYGFSNKQFERQPMTVNVGQLQQWIDRGRVDVSKPITARVLYECGLLSKVPKDGVKILGEGSAWFEARVDLHVSAVSSGARKAIEKRGGSVTTIYYNKADMRAFVKGAPHRGRWAHAPPSLADRFDIARPQHDYIATSGRLVNVESSSTDRVDESNESN
jgi:large subunit ribosomal protein L15